MAVLERRYLARDESGEVVETPEEMFRRVAANVASAERKWGGGDEAARWEGLFFEAMSGLEFLPNSPTLMNAGRTLQQLAACFVLPVEDSIESIFEAVKLAAVIHQSGGGTGFSFSRLRPENDIVSSTGGLSSGPLSFMRVFDAATDAIRQGGARRGANMAVLSIDHPDVEKFIRAKGSPGEFHNFNLSVAVTDAFMETARTGGEHRLVNPRTGEQAAVKDAAGLLELLCRNAWECGEPGVLFMDAVNRANPTPRTGTIEATNPCGEQPLLPYEACNLGSINLSRMVRNGPAGPEIDYRRLGELTELAVRFLDDVIEVNRYPAPPIEAATRLNRKIGLGVMGLADMFIRLGLVYGSDESLSVAGELMTFIGERARAASRALASSRGPFPNFRGSIYDRPGARPLRNATVTTIAPTGTLSIIAGVSSGIEPLYAVSYRRRMLDDLEMELVSPLFVETAEKGGFLSEDLVKHIEAGGSIRERPDVPDEVKRLFVTALEVDPLDHVRMQAAFQRHTDNAVSKTVNLPDSATVEDVRRVVVTAHELGCKGVTVYRSGTRAGQVLACQGARPC